MRFPSDSRLDLLNLRHFLQRDDACLELSIHNNGNSVYYNLITLDFQVITKTGLLQLQKIGFGERRSNFRERTIKDLLCLVVEKPFGKLVADGDSLILVDCNNTFMHMLHQGIQALYPDPFLDV